MTIKVKDPGTSEFHELNVIPVDNIPEPGWSVTLSNNACVLLNLKNGSWESHPDDLIDYEFAQSIGYEINPSTRPVADPVKYVIHSWKSKRPRL
jgi:hypothetical protein